MIRIPEISPSVAEKITKGIYVHDCWGGNITISSGKDGLLIIDTGYPQRAVYTDSIIRAAFGKPVRYILNTHLHYDHVSGNHLLAKDGAVILAHQNTRKRMLEEWKVPEFAGIKFPVIPPFKDDYLPKLCFSDSITIYFSDSITIYFNDEIIKCVIRIL